MRVVYTGGHGEWRPRRRSIARYEFVPQYLLDLLGIRANGGLQQFGMEAKWPYPPGRQSYEVNIGR